MFSDRGEKLVDLMVQDALKLPLSTSDQELYSFIRERMSNIELAGHAEVFDTAVKEAFIGEIEFKTKRELSIYF